MTDEKCSEASTIFLEPVVVSNFYRNYLFSFRIDSGTTNAPSSFGVAGCEPKIVVRPCTHCNTTLLYASIVGLVNNVVRL